jgi:hypothetical protein
MNEEIISERITMKDGRVFEHVWVNGGGTALFGRYAGRRELHGTLPGEEFFCEFEDEILRREQESSDG